MTWLSDPRPGAACAIVAEVAQAHDGSLGMAHAYIDAAAQAGATAIKFQTHIADAESTPAEPWRRRFSYQDASRYDYWRRMEFTPEQWAGLKAHADERSLIFLSSPFSLEAVELLRDIGMPAWKIASGELSNSPLIEAIVETGQPIMLSSGMSDFAEIDAVVAQITKAGCPLAVMQCSSIYPCPAEQIGINVLDEFRRRYGTAVGLSDHSGTIFPGLAAAAFGAEVLEVHITLCREMFGPDVSSSVTAAEFKTLVDGIRFIERMNRCPIDRTSILPAVEPLRATFMKSVVACHDLNAGTMLTAAMVAAKKPGGGIPAGKLHELYGRRLARDVCRNEQLQLTDLE
ncbi:MAG: N-acetylneuraminate synthase family protein [Proteobacteria bacterium]|nr:N-acetylneuraminate synthase family protein [Pseudomonadota bacterium]